MICPWTEDCVARASGLEQVLPRRAEKGEKPLRRGIAFWLERPDGRVLFRKRPEAGLLGGLWEVPSTAWEAEFPQAAEARRHAPIAVPWRPLKGLVRHSFTHFDLELVIWRGRADERGTITEKAESRWVTVQKISEIALPNLMKKVVAHATHG
jgi:A/G-specific adenine glycosylase